MSIDLKTIFIEMLGIGVTVFFVMALHYGRRERILKKGPLNRIEGTVVEYYFEEPYAPVVVYEVEGETYKKRLKYSYYSSYSVPWNAVKMESEQDLLAPSLKVKKNSILSVNDMMKERFPVGSNLEVYYCPEHPKTSYVARYAPSHTGKMMFASGLVLLVMMIIIVSVM